MERARGEVARERLLVVLQRGEVVVDRAGLELAQQVEVRVVDGAQRAGGDRDGVVGAQQRPLAGRLGRAQPLDLGAQAGRRDCPPWAPRRSSSATPIQRSTSSSPRIVSSAMNPACARVLVQRGERGVLDVEVELAARLVDGHAEAEVGERELLVVHAQRRVGVAGDPRRRGTRRPRRPAGPRRASGRRACAAPGRRWRRRRSRGGQRSPADISHASPTSETRSSTSRRTARSASGSSIAACTSSRTSAHQRQNSSIVMARMLPEVGSRDAGRLDLPPVDRCVTHRTLTSTRAERVTARVDGEPFSGSSDAAARSACGSCPAGVTRSS